MRRAFLCGQDPVFGNNCDQREAHVRERLARLAATLATDIGAYALVSNHYLLVLRLDPARVHKHRSYRALAAPLYGASVRHVLAVAQRLRSHVAGTAP